MILKSGTEVWAKLETHWVRGTIIRKMPNNSFAINVSGKHENIEANRSNIVLND